MITHFTRIFTVAVACVLFAGCATEVAQYTLIGSARPSKPEGYEIQVFTNGLPSQPFDRVAILDAHCESQGFMVPNLEQDGLPILKKQARKAGCDAIIEIKERQPQDNWTLETKVRRFTATGIAFK